MNCPLCLDAPLEPKFVGRTEVDICVRCRGIWLDRGELDRMLDQSSPSSDAPLTQGSGRPHDRYDGGARSDERRTGKTKKKRSKSQRLADLFEEVLDF